MKLTTSSSLGATAPIPVFDIDTHFTEPPDIFTSRAPARFKDKVPYQKIVDGVTLNDETFPYLAAKEVSVLGGITARLFRISFSGELAYELAVPARYGDAVIRAVMAARSGQGPGGGRRPRVLSIIQFPAADVASQ